MNALSASTTSPDVRGWFFLTHLTPKRRHPVRKPITWCFILGVFLSSTTLLKGQTVNISGRIRSGSVNEIILNIQVGSE